MLRPHIQLPGTSNLPDHARCSTHYRHQPTLEVDESLNTGPPSTSDHSIHVLFLIVPTMSCPNNHYQCCFSHVSQPISSTKKKRCFDNSRQSCMQNALILSHLTWTHLRRRLPFESFYPEVVTYFAFVSSLTTSSAVHWPCGIGLCR